MANTTSDYRGTGTEPLRSDPTPITGSVTASPTGAGKDAGGTENMKAQPQTFQTARPMPGKGTTHFPAISSFDGEKV